MFLSFGACIALEMVLFVFANDSSQIDETTAILQKFKTLEKEVSMLKQRELKTSEEISMLKQRELKTLEEVSMLKQMLNSCQGAWNEFSKSNPGMSECMHTLAKCPFGFVVKYKFNHFISNLFDNVKYKFAKAQFLTI